MCSGVSCLDEFKRGRRDLVAAVRSEAWHGNNPSKSNISHFKRYRIAATPTPSSCLRKGLLASIHAILAPLMQRTAYSPRLARARPKVLPAYHTSNHPAGAYKPETRNEARSRQDLIAEYDASVSFQNGLVFIDSLSHTFKKRFSSTPDAQPLIDQSTLNLTQLDGAQCSR